MILCLVAAQLDEPTTSSRHSPLMLCRAACLPGTPRLALPHWHATRLISKNQSANFSTHPRSPGKQTTLPPNGSARTTNQDGEVALALSHSAGLISTKKRANLSVNPFFDIVSFPTFLFFDSEIIRPQHFLLRPCIHEVLHKYRWPMYSKHLFPLVTPICLFLVY